MTKRISHTVIVAEDELPIREQILEFLAKREEFSVIGTAANGADLKNLLRQGADLALLDIDLPVKNTMEVIAEMDTLPRIIFITAYDSYAVKAFEIGAVDFLVKPISEERFYKALDRAKEAINFSSQRSLKKPESLWVREDSFIRPLPVKNVVFMEANDKYTKIYTVDEEFSILKPIRRIFQFLDQDIFLQIHRKYVVNREFVRSMIVASGGRHQIALHAGKMLPVGRTFYKNLKNIITI